MADMMMENKTPQRYIQVHMFGDEFIPVNDVYPYIYESEKGKMVLRIRIPVGVKSFDQILAMFKEGDYMISSWEDETKRDQIQNEDGSMSEGPQYTVKVLRNEFEHFCKDIKCDYNDTDQEYSIEITRKTDTELALEENQKFTLDAYAALAEIYESL